MYLILIANKNKQTKNKYHFGSCHDRAPVLFQRRLLKRWTDVSKENIASIHRIEPGSLQM
jgi:hypothetical protein